MKKDDFDKKFARDEMLINIFFIVLFVIMIVMLVLFVTGNLNYSYEYHYDVKVGK